MAKLKKEKTGVPSHSPEQSNVKATLHLRLTYEDWKECFKTLTKAELGIFLAIRTLDPYGDRTLEIDCSALGKELELHRTSVSRALESLSKKQLIDLEIVKVKVKQKVSNRKLTLLNRVENTRNNEQEQEKETCASTHTSEHPRTTSCAHAQPIAPAHTSEHPRTQQPPEPLQHNDSSVPHTIQTYTDFKKTLSKDQRESLEKFVREEYYKEEGKKIRNFTAFMSNDHFQEWYQKYQNRPEAVQVAQSNKWIKHPQFNEWVAEIESSGNPMMFASGNKEKKEFVKWANENQIFSWQKEGR